jgi:hypothetical protein
MAFGFWSLVFEPSAGWLDLKDQRPKAKDLTSHGYPISQLFKIACRYFLIRSNA